MLSSTALSRILRTSRSSLQAGIATQRPTQARSGQRKIPNQQRPLQPVPPNRPPPQLPPQASSSSPSTTYAVSTALRDASLQDNNLLAPVHVPEDPDGVLNEKHPAAKLLANSSIVVQRQLELINLLVGFEQANKYIIMDPQGNHIGYMAEREIGMGNLMARQMFSTHRSFETHVFDKFEREVLRFHRPFSWISSRIGVYDPLNLASGSHSSSTALAYANPSSGSNGASTKVSQLALLDMRVIGEAQQQWAPLRRKYNLFLFRRSPPPKTSLDTPKFLPGDHSLSQSQQLQVSQAPKGDIGDPYSQFAYVDEPFLSWDFSLLSADAQLIGSVNRNFAGFGREIFTDTGVYALRMDAAGLADEPRHLISKTGEKHKLAQKTTNAGMTLDQRAVMLATAVSVDFDYFSRKSGVGGGFLPLWFPGMGGGEAAGGVAGAEAAGGAVEGGTGAVGNLARGAGAVGEGAAVGAGSVAGYEATQRGTYGNDVSSATGQAQAPASSNAPHSTQPGQGEDVWGEETNPWSGGSGEPGQGRASSGGGHDGGGDEGGDGFDISDWF